MRSPCCLFFGCNLISYRYIILIRRSCFHTLLHMGRTGPRPKRIATLEQRAVIASVMESDSEDEDITDVSMMDLKSTLSTRYLSRPALYNQIRHRNWQLAIDKLLAQEDEYFRRDLRLTPSEFTYLLGLIGDHPIFMSTGRRPQAPPQYQLALALYRFLHDGNASSAFQIGNKFQIGGTHNIKLNEISYVLLIICLLCRGNQPYMDQPSDACPSRHREGHN
jgi:hypothetical protein